MSSIFCSMTAEIIENKVVVSVNSEVRTAVVKIGLQLNKD